MQLSTKSKSSIATSVQTRHPIKDHQPTREMQHGKIFTMVDQSILTTYSGNSLTGLPEIGINSIEKSEAMRLPNQTVPTNGDPNQYIVGLDVFHQLHCLNHLRKTLYPERYHVFENLTGEDLRISMEHTGSSALFSSPNDKTQLTKYNRALRRFD
jgi:hypothetical protein